MEAEFNMNLSWLEIVLLQKILHHIHVFDEECFQAKLAYKAL